MEKEAEEERIRRQKAAAERAFQDGITKARLVLRRTPLGTDRNHNRSELLQRLPLKLAHVVQPVIKTTVSSSDTGSFLTWFLGCTWRKAGCTKASSIASLLLLMTNRLSSTEGRKQTLTIHKVPRRRPLEPNPEQSGRRCLFRK